jgi:hypothetical protein
MEGSLMPSVYPLLNGHIRKLARRELKPIIAETKKRTAEHRRAIAALKREIRSLRRELMDVNKRTPRGPAVPEKILANARLRIDGLKSHRTKLGLSAADYGKLLGVSGLTVYHWEQGKSKPRRSHLPKIVSVRGIGKREALKRLSEVSR